MRNVPTLQEQEKLRSNLIKKLRLFPGVGELSKDLVENLLRKKTKGMEISYDGEWPNLCAGNLVIEMGGKRYIGALSSGGGLYGDNYEIVSRPRKILFPYNFPVQYKKAATEWIQRNIHWGCCGGCA